MRSTIYLLLAFFLLFSCKSTDKEAQRIVDRSIQAHGGKLFEKAKISFDFRERYYEIFKSPKRYEYIREFTDSTGMVRDVLNNDGFQRTINGKLAALTDERTGAFTRSVNSVAYFAYLPYGLNDPAVFKTYLGEDEIDGKKYFLVQVTFSEEGGGEDFDDVFLYWFNQDNYLIDYLAYSYHTDGGGVRFRKAIQQHEVGGLILQDYENYKPEDKNTPVFEMGKLYKSDKLELLSEILLENIRVDFVE
ncbi:DUF6503 family protein [Shivajiella indica]|uniref:DUF6503 family protein n=1 Tax=Shivajiella indica TaxID=872115 RepID=A0ABW5BCF3_9BACT